MDDLLPFGAKARNFINTPYAQDARINILHGSVRSSKTACMIPKLLLQILPNAPPGVGLFTGVSKDTIYDNVLNDIFEYVGEGSYDYNRHNGDLILLGRKCKVVGAKDEGSEKYIRGKTVPWAYSDETSLMPEGFFTQLLSRMSLEGAKFYGTTNPEDPLLYLYKDYIANPEKLLSGMVKAIHFELDDNPNLSEEYKSFIRSAYSGVYYQRRVLGLWVVAEGAIYKDCFADEENTFDDDEAPKGFKVRWIPCDYGTANPTVFLDGWFDGYTLWFMKEYYWDSAKEGRQKTDSQYADDMVEFVGNDKRNLNVIIDPSAASFKLELKQRGFFAADAENDAIDIENANNIVLNGIRFTSQMFATNRVKLHKRHCAKTIAEIKSYVWDKKKTEGGKEQPLKKNDHGPDAVRYGVFTKMIKAINWGNLI